MVRGGFPPCCLGSNDGDWDGCVVRSFFESRKTAQAAFAL
jgi:hypothetical protein